MKRKGIIIAVLLMILLTGCGKNSKNENDALKFKKEYEAVNETISESGKQIRSLEIPKDNPFVYKTAEEIVEKIENKESFIVYFGFATCPWCRSVLEELIRVAKDQKVETIYYVDVLDIRDVMEVGEDGNITTKKQGSSGYQKLITLLTDVLEDYTLTKDEEEIPTGEKRIYAPNVVAISKGEAKQLETGISEELTDPYGELTDSIKEYAYNKFKCLMECLEEESNTCQKNMC